jgi:hypothetical protein
LGVSLILAFQLKSKVLSFIHFLLDNILEVVSFQFLTHLYAFDPTTLRRCILEQINTCDMPLHYDHLLDLHRFLVIQTSFFCVCSQNREKPRLRQSGGNATAGREFPGVGGPADNQNKLSKATASFQRYIRTMDPREREAREKKQKQTRELLDRAYDRVVTAQLEKLSSIKTFTGEELEE